MELKMLFLLLSSFSLLPCQGQISNDSLAWAKHHNKIDDIANAKQIQSFIKSVDKRYADFKVLNPLTSTADKECKRLYDSLKINAYAKLDLDKNGYTDLLAIGERSDPSIICIFGQPENKFSIKWLTRRNFQDCSFPVIDTTNPAQVFIDYYYFKASDVWQEYDTTRILETKKLIYKFGDFVEYNNSPKSHAIEKIEYNTTMCFGTCPVFNLVINADRSAKYDAVKYNKQKGNFHGTLNEKDYTEIVELLNYIDFPNLENNYRVGWTDDQTCTLIITYNNGEKKKISDYGKIGTYGLGRVYAILFNLRETQFWK